MTHPQSQIHTELGSIAKGAGITLLGAVFGRGVFFFYTILLARLLPGDELGFYFLGYAITSFLTILGTLGLDVGNVRFVAIYNTRNEVSSIKKLFLRTVSIVTISAIVIALITALLSDVVATSVFQKPGLALALKLFSFVIVTDSLLKICVSVLQGLKLIRYSVFCDSLVLYVSRLVLTLLFLPGLGWGLTGVIIAHGLSSIICFGLAVYFLRSRQLLNAKAKTDQFFIRPIISYSLPMMLSTFIFNVSRQVDILILGIMVTAQEVGFYSAAVRLIVLGEIIFQVFQPIFHPSIAEIMERKEIRKLADLLKTLTRWSVMISLPIFLSLIVFPEFYLQLFGREFVAASSCLSILSIAYLFSPLSNLPNSVIFMSGHSNVTVKNNALSLIIGLILNYLLISRLGIVGAAIASGVTLLIMASIRLLEAHYLIGVHPFSKTLWKPCVAGLISLAFALLFKHSLHLHSYMHVTILFLIGLFVYLVLLFKFRFRDEDIYVKDLFKKKIFSLFTA
jgi:O-antigen/teichoic acid export membrane protein